MTRLLSFLGAVALVSMVGFNSFAADTAPANPCAHNPCAPAAKKEVKAPKCKKGEVANPCGKCEKAPAANPCAAKPEHK